MEKDKISYLAKLSFINLTTEEEQEFLKQLNDLFEHIEETLDNVNENEIETKEIIRNKLELFHEDSIKKEFTREEMLMNVNKEKNGYILVPKIIKEDN